MRMLSKNIKAAIFDLDRTLFDSVGLWHEIDDIFLNKRGLVPTDEYRRAIAAIGFRATADFTIEYYKLDDTPEQLMNEWTELAREAYATAVKTFDGVHEYLAACAANGIKIAAVTSLHIDFAQLCLKNNGIFRYFSNIVTSDETGLKKSSPEIYLHAAKRLGVAPSDCVVYDDVPIAINAAKAAGMITVAIEGAMFNMAECGACADFVVRSIKTAPRFARD
ncbi:MAG: HAD family phosphatase [Clostridiales bacterium]|nr:HAD family phosphatase [Clostridiales bacterium]